ncbi:MAG: Sb-PDE family phosphodiesterase [Candidatus Hydrogenedentota bacterium]
MFSMFKLVCSSLCVVFALTANADTRSEIQFPDIPGYKTIIADFHTHTVFSDGLVWPTVRMDEAWREGIDAIAVTDHIEYQPHKEYVSDDHNASYKVALPTAQRKNIMLIKGTEITRDTPPGHFNAVFIKDVDPIDTPKFLEAVEAAIDQGGFVFWNHPAWQGAERGAWKRVHDRLHEKGWLGGIEVLNGTTYYPDAHQWCLDKGLAMLGNSDYHSPSMLHHTETGDHRALTLVFVKEFTQDGVKEALNDARTAAWGQNRMIGRKEHLGPLFDASIEVFPAHYEDGNNLWVEIKNNSHLTYELKRRGDNGPGTITLTADARVIVRVENRSGNTNIELEYEAENVLIGPGEALPVTLTIPR